VERRYALDDFERFFAGYGVTIEGTVAGLSSYPPAPHAQSAERERFGEFAYQLLREADACLRAQDRDFGARHWCIYAERGGAGVPRRVARAQSDLAGGASVQGRYDLEYLACDGPDELAAASTTQFKLRLRNRGWDTWYSDVAQPVLVSYHWLGRDRRMLVRDGTRSALPHPLRPGESAVVDIEVLAPDQPGRYVLQFDLVHEGTTWFSEVGQPPFEMSCLVRSPGARR
jgi:hypothetical protein